MASRIDWNQAKLDFIADPTLTLEDIATKYKMGYKRVRTVAAKESWTKLRTEKQAKVGDKALDKLENKMADMVVRQTKVSQYLVSAGTKYLKFILDEIEDLLAVGNDREARKLIKQLIYNKIISPGLLMEMIGEGSRIERELYPKETKLAIDANIEGEGISLEMEEVVYDALRAKLGRKRASIHRGNKNKKPTQKEITSLGS
jgi:hypothetical protein